MDKTKNLKRDIYNISKNTGLAQIVIYYSSQSKVKRFSTGVKCIPENWDKKKCDIGKGKISKTEKAIVDNLYNNIYKIITDYQYQYNLLPPIDFIEAKLKKPVDTSENIFKLYDEFLKWKIKTTEYKTSKLYSETGRFLKEVDKRHKYKLNLHNLNYDFIQKFISYLVDVRGNQNSSVNIRLGDLKAFVEWLNKKEIPHSIKPDLWEKVENNSAEDFTCLERNELNAILHYQPDPNDNLKTRMREERTRDLIIFLSHTGLRVGDIKSINKHSINKEKNLIQIEPEKTKRKRIKAIIPITKPVWEILEKYEYKPPFYNTKSLTANIRRLCKKIKELQTEIEYIKVVKNQPTKKYVPKFSVLDSHAIGRKTFINLCIEKRVQLTTIAGMTGHKNIDSIMKHYADKHANKQTALNDVFEI